MSQNECSRILRSISINSPAFNTQIIQTHFESINNSEFLSTSKVNEISELNTLLKPNENDMRILQACEINFKRM